MSLCGVTKRTLLNKFISGTIVFGIKKFLVTNVFDVNYEKNLRSISLINFFTLPLLIKLTYN